MNLNYRILGIGIIIMFFTAMMPFSAMILLSLTDTEILVLGIQQIFFFLGWFINPIIMIITGIVIMRMSDSDEYTTGLLTGVILGSFYTALTLFLQFNFVPEAPQVLPLSGVEMITSYMGSFYELIIKAYIFSVIGGLLGAYSIRRGAPAMTMSSKTL